MRTRIAVHFGALPFALWATSAHAQGAAQTSPVERVAQLIQVHYFDEARAAAVAASLRAAAARGEFDRLTDPRDLASALSERLAREDGHFSVSWADPKDTAGAREPSGPERMAEDVRAARWNFGFRRIALLPGNVGLIELTEFADLDAEKDSVSPAIRAANAALALVERVDALIFDLRDNGGGGGMAGYVLSHFLPPGIVFSEMRGRDRTRENRTLTRIGGIRRLDLPLYVLVSGRTGSAAEFFAYSLQAIGRATIVGERTAGAANPGMTFDAGEGFEIFIPLDTPINRRTGTNWESSGVQPHVSVAAIDALEQAQILALQRVVNSTRSAPEARDARWALESLRGPIQEPDTTRLAELTGTYGSRVLRIESGRLVLQRARWPLRVLRPLGSDLFFVDALPWRRVSFERDAEGRVVAMIESASDGEVTRWRKTP